MTTRKAFAAITVAVGLAAAGALAATATTPPPVPRLTAAQVRQSADLAGYLVNNVAVHFASRQMQHEFDALLAAAALIAPPIAEAPAGLVAPPPRGICGARPAEARVELQTIHAAMAAWTQILGWASTAPMRRHATAQYTAWSSIRHPTGVTGCRAS